MFDKKETKKGNLIMNGNELLSSRKVQLDNIASNQHLLNARYLGNSTVQALVEEPCLPEQSIPLSQNLIALLSGEPKYVNREAKA
jgi:hypothetical protein